MLKESDTIIVRLSAYITALEHQIQELNKTLEALREPKEDGKK